MENAEHEAPEELVEARRRKASELRAAGSNPFANDQGDVTPLAEVRAACMEGLRARTNEELAGAPDRSIAGRVMAMRRMGKVSFLRLRDRTGDLQLFCRANVLGDDYERLDAVDVGDFVVAKGRPLMTRTGELSIEARALRLLTKALRPLPEKWHGLSDVETRYRRRYVDLVANPDVAEVFRARATILRAIRAFLDERGFIEVETPTLHTLVGGAAARPFTTHHNALDMELFLRIAPELYLKRCVVGGLERVYDLGRCYRNEGISTRHNPEFTMLELYQAYATYDTLMELTEELLRSVDRLLARAVPAAHESWAGWRKFALPEAPWPRVRMKDGVLAAARKLGHADWERAAGRGIEAVLDLCERAAGDGLVAEHGGALRTWDASAEDWALASDRAERVDWKNFGRGWHKADDAGERLFVLFEYLCEPFLCDDYRTADGLKSVPVFVVDYPVEVSPLARNKDSDPTLVDRFELFVDGRELCNAFSELNDPDEQAARFRAQVDKKAKGDEETMDFDADYVRALEHGMPPTAGFGMGVDRLVMTLCAQPSIRDVILFPLLRAER